MIWLAYLLAAMTPIQAIDALKEGNSRFHENKATNPRQSQEYRLEMSKIQTPFATIVGCSDSRASPEIIFDQGLGDLFIVRVAGNVVGPLELDSIEYSAEIIHSSLIVILGHQNCGAITAVLEGQTQDIEAIALQIQPAVEQTKNIKKNRLEKTIKLNAQMIAARLQKNPILQKLIEKQLLEIIPAYYHFDSGQVEWLR
jgi:carbonic anhydrase